MNKKLKAIILTIWFILSLLFLLIICPVYQDLLTIGILNISICTIHILSDEDLSNMDLF